MKKLLLTVVAVMAVAAGASADTTWTVGDMASGSNTENMLAIAEAVNWTNSHIEVSLTSGSIINFTGMGVSAAAFSAMTEDTGCFPISASVAYHQESATSIETDWGVAGGLASLDPAYIVTLTPDAVGTWYLKSYFLDGSSAELSGAIVGGEIVPEPMTMSLLGLGGLALIRRRK